MALRSCLEGKACVLGREKFHGSRQWSVMFIDLPKDLLLAPIARGENIRQGERVFPALEEHPSP